MRRRELLVALGAGLAWPMAAASQQTARPTPKTYRIGILEPTSQSMNRVNFEAFRDGLRDLGYIEGQNIVIDYRSADGRSERFPELAAELMRQSTDVLVVRGTPAALAAKGIGRIPVVMSAVADPVGAGLVEVFDRPGGNLTGLATFVRQLTANRIAVLKELLPKATRVGNLLNMSNPAGVSQWKETEATARSLRMQAVLLDVREPKDFAQVFEAAVAQKTDAVLVNLDALIVEYRRAVAEFAAKHKLPAIYADAEFVEAGGADVLRRALPAPLLPRSGLRGQDPEGREARRAADRAADQAAAGDQPAHREKSRADDSPQAPAARRPRHRLRFTSTPLPPHASPSP